MSSTIAVPACWCGGAAYDRVTGGRLPGGGMWDAMACRGCGQVRILPVPPPDQQDAGRGDAPTTYRSDRPVLWEAFAKECLGMVARLRESERPGRLLDVGCSVGALVKASQAQGWEAAGVDRDAVATRYGRDHLGVNLHTGDLVAVNFPEGTYDVVVMNHVIEHVDDLFPLLKEILRVLTPGGLLVVSTPNIAGWPAAWLGARWYGWCPDQHVWLFTPGTLAAVFRQSGFASASVETHFNMDYEKTRTWWGWPFRIPLALAGAFGHGDNLWMAGRKP